MKTFTSGFNRLLDTTPQPHAPQAQGLQEGTILDVIDHTATFTLEGNPVTSYGPAPIPRGITVNSGDRCLIAFLGVGVDRPWVISVTDAPRNQG